MGPTEATTQSPKINFVNGQKRTPFKAYASGSKRRKSRKKASRSAGVHQLDGQIGKTSDIPDGLIGEPNECLVMVNGLSTIALLDSGSMGSTITSQYWNENFPDQPVHPLDDLLTLSGAGGSEIPYVEVDMKLPGLDASPFPFLVVEETEYNFRVPVLIGTNILNKILDGLVNAHGVRFAQKASLPSAMNCALSVIQTARKTLGKRKNVICEVHLCEITELAPGEGRRVVGCIRVDTPIPKQVALVSGVKKYQAGGVEVTPTAVCVEQHDRYIQFDMLNRCTRHVTLPGGTVVANLVQVQLMEMTAVGGHPQDGDRVFQCFGPDFKQDELPQRLLTSVRENIWHLQCHRPGPWENRSDQTSHDITILYSLQGEDQESSTTYVRRSASALKADAGPWCDPTIKQPLDIQCCLGAQAQWRTEILFWSETDQPALSGWCQLSPEDRRDLQELSTSPHWI